MRRNKLFYSILLLIVYSTQNLFAAADEADMLLDTVAKIMLVVTFLFILFILWLVVVYAERNDSSGDLFLSPMRKLYDFITRSTPIEKEHEILMEHEYDGIKELDNRIPPWFHALFYGTIIMSVIYMFHYHVIGSGNVQADEYNEEVLQASLEREILIKSGAFLDEETVRFVDDAASLQSGKDVYTTKCAVCHGNGGEGIVGPNLTDDYWIHGGGIKNIFRVVKDGVPQKGMISWKSQLTPNQMQEVSSYIITLHGTNPPNPKAAEGEIWKDESVSSEVDETKKI